MKASFSKWYIVSLDFLNVWPYRTFGSKSVLFQCSKTLQNQTNHMINIISLTHLSQIELPTFIKKSSPFSIPGLLGVFFIQILIEQAVSKQ